MTPALEKAYLNDPLSAREALRRAEWIAFGPIIFQASRIMVKWGILDMLRDSDGGLTLEQLVERTGKSRYAIQVLLEASLTIGTVILAADQQHYLLAKTGWMLLADPLVKVNMDFNHDVNYEGWFRLEESLDEGRPAGLEHFGPWPTVYEALSSLPPQVQQSWFGFDHFYSDHSFPQALEVVFQKPVATLLDVGGNTGRWAMQCVAHDPQVQVTIIDLPQQLQLMRQNVSGNPGADRIHGYPMNLLDPDSPFPSHCHFDVIWMSQFLDCFGEEQIVSILSRAAAVMDSHSRLLIMETLWDRQRFPVASMCLTLTSLYFTAIANGNSRMYNTSDMERLIAAAGLRVERIVDNLGHGHSIMEVRTKD